MRDVKAHSLFKIFSEPKQDIPPKRDVVDCFQTTEIMNGLLEVAGIGPATESAITVDRHLNGVRRILS
jgi:hypothetical protein